MRSASVLAIGLAVAILLAGCSQGATKDFDAPAMDPETGDVPIGPNWTFKDTDGLTQSRDQSLGAPAAIFFMATWCASCQKLAPRLATVEKEYRDQGFQMYTVSWDPNEDVEDLQEWKNHYDNTWPHGLDERSRIAQTFHITSQSSVVILDGYGNPVKTWIYNAPTTTSLREAIDEAFVRSNMTAA